MNAIGINRIKKTTASGKSKKEMSKEGEGDNAGSSSGQNRQNGGQSQNRHEPPINDDDRNAATSIRPPRPLIFDTNMELKWKEWIQQFNWYAIATQLNRKPNAVQAATLMASMGMEAAAVFNTFNLNDEQQENIELIKTRFTEYFTPRSNLTYERYLFNSMHQEGGENFDNFTTRLKTQIKKCEFGELSDSLLVDKIIIGISSEDVRKKLLAEDDLTLAKTTRICKINEQTIQQLDNMSTKKSVELIRTKRDQKGQKGKQSASGTSADEEFDCRRCGTKHQRMKCPAFKKKCEKCGIPGHLSSCCRTRQHKKKVHSVDPESEEEIEELRLNEITEDDSIEKFVLDVKPAASNDNWYETININNRDICFKLDTGAQCNVLPYKYIKNSKIK